MFRLSSLKTCSLGQSAFNNLRAFSLRHFRFRYFRLGHLTFPSARAPSWSISRLFNYNYSISGHSAKHSALAWLAFIIIPVIDRACRRGACIFVIAIKQIGWVCVLICSLCSRCQLIKLTVALITVVYYCIQIRFRFGHCFAISLKVESHLLFKYIIFPDLFLIPNTRMQLLHVSLTQINYPKFKPKSSIDSLSISVSISLTWSLS